MNSTATASEGVLEADNLAGLNITERHVCPVCDGSGARRYVEFPEMTFNECMTCGTVYRSRELAGVLPGDFYEKDYFHGRKSGRDKRFEHRVRKAQSWLTDCLDSRPEAATLLDVGCSFGYVLEGARRSGLSASGVDISTYAVDRCRSLGFDARVGLVDALPFDDSSFDIVVMKHVLEHTPQPLKALREVKRVLKPRGQVLLAVPDLDYWKGRWWRQRGRYFRPEELGGQHFVYFHEEALARAIEGSQLTVTIRNKAYLRKAARRPIVEWIRFAMLWIWQALAKRLHLRRELYFVATNKDGPT